MPVVTYELEAAPHICISNVLNSGVPFPLLSCTVFFLHSEPPSLLSTSFTSRILF